MKCKYPKCKNRADKTWALVHLCDGHHETIKEESHLFYTKPSRTQSEVMLRPHYSQIDNLIPWSKSNTKVVDRE